jgi:hypothetical protein
MEDIKIYYGIINNKIDVTNICFTTLNHNNIIKIPSKDSNRAFYFSDPCPGTMKSIFILFNEYFYLLK